MSDGCRDAMPDPEPPKPKVATFYRHTLGGFHYDIETLKNLVHHYLEPGHHKDGAIGCLDEALQHISDGLEKRQIEFNRKLNEANITSPASTS